ncbi:GNAT family N-acetyltransferase [Anaerosporobacter sp.]|uniref:GNAT family N-acetyltransferase n=1 Tax=Anaerosporobacter sp. TaxID=1872529 RepID=UPI00286F4793|nr:GNAT family protein [Anaerosporobacter sp.]
MLKECLWIPVLKTERLILRKLTLSDADDLREWLGLDIVYKYWSRAASKGEKNPELLFVDSRPNVKRKPSHDFIWGIEYENKVIDIIEVFDVENDRLGKIGYRINPKHWNKGICSEALNCVVRFVFTETSLDRLETTVDVNNIGSNSVLKKCGFIHEGSIRPGKFGSRYCDYNIYGLIKDDFAC